MEIHENSRQPVELPSWHNNCLSGECCQKLIDRLAGVAKDNGCTAVIGIGGGRTLDTTKGVAHYAGIPMVIVPTIASSDAPCSSCSVVQLWPLVS